MGALQMAPLVVDGVMRPDLDRRHVPAATMAAYLGLSRTTLWRRTLDGFYEAGVKTVGTRHYYQPRAVVGG